MQIFPELRGEHARRLRSSPEVMAAFVGVKWDLGDSALPDNARRFTRPRLVRYVLGRDFDVVELPEPLWLRELPYTALIAYLVRLRSTVARHPTTLVFYAIENNDLNSLLGGGQVHRVMRVPVAWAVRFVLRSCGRYAFGSPSAQAAYASVAGATMRHGRLVLELPEASKEATTAPAPYATCVFVGELSQRKGLSILLQAWEEVETHIPEASLSIVGDGLLRDSVAAWCATRPSSRQWLGQVEADEVRRVVSRHAVLVAPSVRWGRWREQIGLPVKEALSVGATVVATDETGLADWLANNGHTVVRADDVMTDLAGALETTLRRPLDRRDVVDSLPVRGGRAVAQAWLHGDVRA